MYVLIVFILLLQTTYNPLFYRRVVSTVLIPLSLGTALLPSLTCIQDDLSTIHLVSGCNTVRVSIFNAVHMSLTHLKQRCLG